MINLQKWKTQTVRCSSAKDSFAILSGIRVFFLYKIRLLYLYSRSWLIVPTLHGEQHLFQLFLEEIMRIDIVVSILRVSLLATANRCLTWRSSSHWLIDCNNGSTSFSPTDDDDTVPSWKKASFLTAQRTVHVSCYRPRMVLRYLQYILIVV